MTIPAQNPSDVIAEIFERVRGMDAPLNARLQILAEAIQVASPEFGAAVEGLIERLARSGCGEAAPAVGEVLPPFLLPDVSGRLVGLDKVVARGPAVISFFRGQWCPYCQLTGAAFAEMRDLIGDAHMVAITPEKPGYNQEFMDATGIGFPVLTDIDCGYALSLNLAFWVDDAFADLMRSVDRDLAIYQAGAAWLLPIPATFVVDSKGVIVSRHIDPDYRRRMDVSDLLEAFNSAE